MSVKYDLFPAFLTVTPPSDPTPIFEMTSGPAHPRDARQFDKARVIVFHDSVMVAVDGDQGPKIIFHEAYTTANFKRSPSRTEDSFIETDSGIKLVFRRNDACGCGSRLRSWNPFRTLNSTKDPTE